MATRKTESNPCGWTSASEVDKGPALIAADERLPKGHVNAWHSHDNGCLIYPAQGVVTVETEAGSYVVPPQRAVWLPAGMAHQTSMNGEVSLQSLIIDDAAFQGVPQGACVVAITPLLRELILHACSMAAEQPVDGPTKRLVSVLVDQLTALQAPALPLPVPQERRLRRIADALIADPADNRSLEDWAKTAGASSRTLARLFRAETGLSFREWRQRLRILEGLRRLAEGESVTTVALDVGFSGPAAFIQAFKRLLGTTPGRYFS